MLTANDIMTKNPITVQPETLVEDLARMFVEHHVGTFPVVDNRGVLLGVVTETDLVEQDKNLHLPTVVSLFDWVIYLEDDSRFKKELRKITSQTVGDLYTTNPVTVAPDTSIDRIADLMAEKRISAIPVVSGGKLEGIVSRIDLIRTMVTP